MHYTEHARSRMQQRTIPPQVVEHILDFGCAARCPGKDGARADVYFMDRRGRAALGNAIGEDRYAQVEGKLNAFVVIGDEGCVVTVGRQTKRRLRRASTFRRRRSQSDVSPSPCTS